MARYIMCSGCEQAWRDDALRELARRLTIDEPDDGKVERYVRGRAKRRMICDGICAVSLNEVVPAEAIIQVGMRCCAITVEPPGVKVPEGWENEHLDPLTGWWWLSFADPKLLPGSTFLGGAIIGPAAQVMDAIELSHKKRCNPGGEVLAHELTVGELDKMPERYRGRLLSRADIEELSSAMGGPGVAERM